MTDEISLPGLADALGDALGTSATVGGFIAVFIFIGLIVFPTLYLTKGRNMILALLEGVLVVIMGGFLGWVPAWISIMFVLLMAALLASDFRDWLSGRGGG